jgi:hypothetical protein
MAIDHITIEHIAIDPMAFHRAIFDLVSLAGITMKFPLNRNLINSIVVIIAIGKMAIDITLSFALIKVTIPK